VLMRKDPPFDSEYFYATHLLEQAEREGAKVFNKPRALRDHPEKLAILEFPQFIGPTLVTREAQRPSSAFMPSTRTSSSSRWTAWAAWAFSRQGRWTEPGRHHRDAEQGRRRDGDGAEVFARHREGDKRVLVIGGKPVPFCLARIPQGGEVRGNLAVGGKGVAQPLSDADRAIAEALGPILAARGLLLVGLDVIGNSLTEINVTSPTCFQEITTRPALTWPRCLSMRWKRRPINLPQVYANTAPSTNTLNSPGVMATQFSLVVSGSVTTMARRSSGPLSSERSTLTSSSFNCTWAKGYWRTR
jgi:glutathione synthase